MRLLYSFVICALLAIGVSSQFLEPPPTTADPKTIKDCTLWHVSVSGDTCPGVSSAYGISPAQLTTYNPSLASGCKFIKGNSYCVEQNWGVPPEQPTTKSASGPTTAPGNGVTTPKPTQSGMVGNCNKFHFVQEGDGCASIGSKYGLTTAQIFAWNPAIGNNCQSMWLNTYLCVGLIGGSPTTKPTTTAGNGISTPTPTQAGMVSNCNKFHLVKDGDGCASIGSKYGVTAAQLFSWNPAIGSNCQSMWLNTYLCVGVVGGLTATKATTKTTSAAPGNGIQTPTPTREGMTRSCNQFYLIKTGDTCQTVSKRYGISLAQFVAWNPSVGSECGGLWLNTWFCVRVIGSTPTTTIKAPATTKTGNGVSTPTPTQPGMVSNCKTFHKVVSGDGCQSIADKYRITLANFVRWNSGVGSDCKSLWLQTYACVGII